MWNAINSAHARNWNAIIELDAEQYPCRALSMTLLLHGYTPPTIHYFTVIVILSSY